MHTCPSHASVYCVVSLRRVSRESYSFTRESYSFTGRAPQEGEGEPGQVFTSFIYIKYKNRRTTTYIHSVATWFYGRIGRPDAAQVGRRHLCDAALELTRHQLEEVATP